MRNHFGLWPTWLPDSSVAIGDFGRIRRGMFVREGHVGALSQSVALERSRANGDHLFASDGVQHTAVTVGQDTPLVAPTARLQIDFGRGFGVFVALRDCRERRLTDFVASAAHLAELTRTDGWRADYCVVTGVVEAAAALIAVSSSSGGEIEVTAAASSPDVMCWLGGKLHITNESHVAYRAMIRTRCTPLFRIARLASQGDLVPRGSRTTVPRLREISAESVEI